MKVVLVQAPWWTVDTPSLAIACLKSSLKSKNIEVHSFEFHLEEYYKGQKKFFKLLFDNSPKNARSFLAHKYTKLSVMKECVHQFQISRVKSPFEKLLRSYFLAILFSDYFPEIKNEEVQKIVEDLKTKCATWVKRILSENPDIVGFSLMNYNDNYYGMINMFCNSFIAQELKKANKSIKIIFGGPAVAKEAFGRFFIRAGWVDVVVIQEGEITLNEIVEHIKKNISLKPCKGAFVNINGKVYENGYRIYNQKVLDSFPFPEFDMKDIKRSRFSFLLPLVGSKGCINNCIFCVRKLLWNGFTPRNYKRVIGELKYYHDVYGISSFRFNNSLINANQDYLSKLCDAIIKERIDVRWGANARVCKDMTDSTFQKMYKAGCRYLCYGLEGGSQKVLDDMFKNIDVKESGLILEKTKKAGIHTGAYFMVGFPSESEEDFGATVNFVKNYNQYLDVGFLYDFDLNIPSHINLNPSKFGVKTKILKYGYPKELKFCCDYLPLFDIVSVTNFDPIKRFKIISHLLGKRFNHPYQPYIYH